MIHWFTELLDGFFSPIQSLQLMFKSKKLLALSLAPVLIALCLQVFFFTSMSAALNDYAQIFILNKGWNINLGWIEIIVGIVVFIVCALTFGLATSVASAPVADFLAEAAEEVTTPSVAIFQKFELARFFRALRIDLLKTLASGIAVIICLALGLMPGVNLAAFLLTALIVAFQFTSYPHTRREVTFGAQVKWMQNNFPRMLGFGLVTMLLLSIPFLGPFTLSLAVIGGTLQFAKIQSVSKL